MPNWFALLPVTNTVRQLRLAILAFAALYPNEILVTRKLRPPLPCLTGQTRCPRVDQRLLAEYWIDPWLDEEKLLPGQDWDMEIEKAVEAAEVVVVCLSNNSVTKEGYVQRELKFVLDIGLEKPEGLIYIIPIRLEGCEVPRRLRGWQYLDYFPTDRKKQAYDKLIRSLEIRAKSFSDALLQIPGHSPNAIDGSASSTHIISQQKPPRTLSLSTIKALWSSVPLAVKAIIVGGVFSFALPLVYESAWALVIVGLSGILAGAIGANGFDQLSSVEKFRIGAIYGAISELPIFVGTCVYEYIRSGKIQTSVGILVLFLIILLIIGALPGALAGYYSGLWRNRRK